MKHTFSKGIGIAAFLMMLLVTTALVPVYAQKDSAPKKLEGSWNVMVTGLDCQTGAPINATTPSILTYNYGGTMEETGSRIAPSRRGPGHGVWSHQTARQYAAAFQFFRFNADGTLAGRQVVRQQIEVSDSGDEFTSYAIGQVLDAAGNVVSTGCSEGLGTRFN